MQSSQVCKVAIGDCVGLGESTRIAAEIYPPPGLVNGEGKAVLFCLPGGACTRDYFDLQVESDISYSFARSMAQRGYWVVTVDLLGVGESSRPQDGFSVTPERLVRANQELLIRLMERAEFSQYALATLPKIAVGHSMGAMLAICQQAWHRSFDGLALLGFGHGGMPDYLCELGKALAKNPASAFAQGVELAQEQFGQGYIRMGSPDADELANRGAPAGLEAAVRNKACDLLAVPGALSLVPNVLWAISREVTVPCFAAMGDDDICGPYEQQSELVAGPVSPVRLENTRHNHFMFPGRRVLYQALDDWCQGNQYFCTGRAGTATLKQP